jgi:hypothetical protein
MMPFDKAFDDVYLSIGLAAASVGLSAGERHLGALGDCPRHFQSDLSISGCRLRFHWSKSERVL